MTTHLARGVGRMSEIVMQRGKGAWVWTVEGQKLLDFTSGIAVTNLGHCHPQVVEAAQKQVATLTHGQVNIGYHAPMLELTEKLLPLLPQGLDSLFFGTTGSEAVENAVKLARHATKKTNIIVFQGGYHGRTLGAMSLTTSKTIYSAGFGPLVSGVTVVPFPYSLHGPIHDEERCSEWCLEQVRLALKQQTAPSDTAAILIEPVLGEGGYVAPPKEFIKGLRKICDQNDILLITDEVQCGFGRTGEYFATNGHFDTVPDILVMAKGIANGFPLSAIASRKELTDRQPPGSMGGTYAGSAVACAAAIATQDVIRDEKVLANTQVRGQQFLDGLNRIKESGQYPILDVRGLGLMVAIEFGSQVPVGTASKVSGACLKNGMLVLTTSVYETIRFMPPLTVTADEVELALKIFENSLKDVFTKFFFNPDFDNELGEPEMDSTVPCRPNQPQSDHKRGRVSITPTSRLSTCGPVRFTTLDIRKRMDVIYHEMEQNSKQGHLRLPIKFLGFHKTEVLYTFCRAAVDYAIAFVHVKSLQQKHEGIDSAHKLIQVQLGLHSQSSLQKPDDDAIGQESIQGAIDLHLQCATELAEAYARLVLHCSNYENHKEDEHFFECVYYYTCSVVKLGIQQEHWQMVEDELAFLFRGAQFSVNVKSHTNAKTHLVAIAAKEAAVAAANEANSSAAKKIQNLTAASTGGKGSTMDTDTSPFLLPKTRHCHFSESVPVGTIISKVDATKLRATHNIQISQLIRERVRTGRSESSRMQLEALTSPRASIRLLSLEQQNEADNIPIDGTSNIAALPVIFPRPESTSKARLLSPRFKMKSVFTARSPAVNHLLPGKEDRVRRVIEDYEQRRPTHRKHQDVIDPINNK